MQGSLLTPVDTHVEKIALQGSGAQIGLVLRITMDQPMGKQD